MNRRSTPTLMRSVASSLLIISALLPLAARAEWAKDAKTGCEVTEIREDWGTAKIVEWSGPCPNGRADGTGTYLRKGVAGEIVRRYVGDMRAGQFDGRGTFYFGDGARYEGEFKAGKFEGKGSFYWPDGTRYEGEYRANRPEGQGNFLYKNGQRYQGSLVAGKREGKGTMHFPDGDRYEGEFKEGLFDGRGSYFFKNGDRYEGQWKQDKYDGQGIMYLADGRRYEGQYLGGKREGRGTYIWTNGERFDGDWKADKRVSGKTTYADGDTYEGGWDGDNRSGFGKRTFASGSSPDIGWFEAGSFRFSCPDESTCLRYVKAKKDIETAEKALRCEEARALNQGIKEKWADFDACSKQRRYETALKAKDPRLMIQQAAVFEADNDTDKAKALYTAVIDRFSNHAMAMTASQRLADIAGNQRDRASSAARENAARAEGAERERRAQQAQELRGAESRSQCEAQKKTCTAQCGNPNYWNGKRWVDNQSWSQCNSTCNSISCN